MDWLTFFSKIIDSLAWPFAAVVLVGLLREEIKKIVPFIKKFKAGPLEAEFEREVSALRKSSAETINEVPDTASKEFLIQLAELHPRSAILESWVRLEAAARAVLSARHANHPKSSYLAAAHLGEPLREIGALNEPQVKLFHELRRLRNDVAHERGMEPNFASARAYIDLASFTQAHLEGQVS